MLMSLQMVTRSPFLLGLSSQTLATRFQALQTAFPDANVQRMVEYYPSLLEVNAACRTTTTAALQHQTLCCCFVICIVSMLSDWCIVADHHHHHHLTSVNSTLL